MHTSGIVSLAAFVSVLAAGVPDVASQGSAMSPIERAIVEHVRAHDDRGAGAARAGREHQQRHDASRRRARGGHGCSARSSSRSGSRRDGSTAPPFKRAGHLVAEHPAAGPRILLIGHLDTVFEPDSPFQKFERVGSTSARGPGVLDMKGGDVIMIQALRALEAAGALKAMNVTVVMTGDEESSGDPQSVAREALVAAAKGAQVAIGFEDGDGHPQHAVIGRRGTASWTLNVTGTPAHSSQIFRDDIGFGAVFEAARISERVSREAGRAGASDVQPGGRPRRDADDVRGAAVARICVRKGQRHPGAGARHRRHSRALEGAVRRRAEGR